MDQICKITALTGSTIFAQFWLSCESGIETRDKPSLEHQRKTKHPQNAEGKSEKVKRCTSLLNQCSVNHNIEYEN